MGERDTQGQGPVTGGDGELARQRLTAFRIDMLAQQAEAGRAAREAQQGLGDYLRAMVDPGTPEEIAAFNESSTRVAENARRLREGLPPGPNGEIGGLRMSEGAEIEPRFFGVLQHAEEHGLPLTDAERVLLDRSHEIVRETEDSLRADLRSSRPIPPDRPMSW
jgi:hypothetical protein